ncbi:hypothetical protein A4A49_60278 [Nicotiana attenuata]|uniref:BPL/LPL catalytic domain-containing protein n=1 Tax=Nicotiana attenuata TaxID=49451 RepID=A0A1J6JMV4_NICAT|nr:hypothetical protein A4A49_60278 [Nicotiana attenuata]
MSYQFSPFFMLTIDARSYEYLIKPAELLEIGSLLQDKIPVVKRFIGGGTVIVDHRTIFISFICNKDVVPTVQPYLRPIMSWSNQLYSKVFQGVGDFSLRENDTFLLQDYFHC